MIRRRAWTLALFLGGWTILFLGSFLAGAGVIMSRYAALPAIPLFIAVAWLLADVARVLGERLPRIAAAASLSAIAAAILAWPAAATVAAARSWQSPVYTSMDARQYVTEFGGGHVTEKALLWLMERADERPITVVTGSWVGNPNDALWLYLSGNPNIQLYWDDYKKTLLHPVAADTYLLGSNRWVDSAHRVMLDLSRPTYYIVPITHLRKAGMALSFVPPEVLPPHLFVQKFSNPINTFTTMDYQELAIIQLQPGARIVQASEQP
jgi:hypothetical protein